MIGGILFLSCLSVCLLSALTFLNLIFLWTVRERDFIFGMHTPLMMPFNWHQGRCDFDFCAKNSFLDFVAASAIVFHKHMYFSLSLYPVYNPQSKSPILIFLNRQFVY